jgi:hypothetical protein
MRTPRKGVNLAAPRAFRDASARQTDGAEKTFRRGFLDCGLFLILAAFRADTTTNRGTGKKFCVVGSEFAVNARLDEHGEKRGESPP